MDSLCGVLVRMCVMYVYGCLLVWYGDVYAYMLCMCLNYPSP